MTSDDVGLRRADWRFLLPAAGGHRFRHLLLLGGPVGLASRLTEAGAADQVSTAPAPGALADAVILLAGAGVPIASVVSCLASDGILYWEIERTPGTWASKRPGAIGRQLRQAGLRAWATYWVVPGFDQARRYLPLEPVGAVEWYLRTRYVASTPARLALEFVLAGAARWSRRVLESLLPSYAVIACGPEHPGGPACALADRALPEIARRAAVRPVLFTSGQDDGSRVVVLPFPAGAAQPALVLKSARLEAFTGHTRREQETLASLRTGLPPELRDTLPEPRGAVECGGATAFLESVVPGRMLAASTGRWRAPLARQIEDLRTATAWLIKFHQSTTAARVHWSPSQSERWLEPVLARFERSFGLERRERELFAGVRRHSRALIGADLPIVWCHNDYNPWHLYRAGRDIGVIDWEFVEDNLAARRGPALCDLLYFLVHWVHLARGLRGTTAQLRGFGDLYLPNGARDVRSEAARRAVRNYTTQLDIEPAFVPLLLVYTWVDRAADWHGRQLAAGSSDPVARRENGFLRYVRLLADNAADLFAGGTGERDPAGRRDTAEGRREH